MNKIIEVLIGCASCGKSTYAKEKVANNINWVRVNKDDIRIELGSPPFSKEVEKRVVEIEDQRIIEALTSGKNVIVDDTNLNPFHLNNRFYPIGEQYGAKVEVNRSFLSVPLEVCIERDKNREASVGENVIRNMYSQYDKWMREDTYWLDGIESRKNKESVFIFDLDGTCAFAIDRSWFNESECKNDKPNIPVLYVAMALKEAFKNAYGPKVIFVSGRKEIAREATCEWLARNFEKHNIGRESDVYKPYSFELYMRKDGDNRPDDIVKEEIYRENIEPHYNVIGVFDDRKRVVSKWRELGLFVFDCNQTGLEF